LQGALREVQLTDTREQNLPTVLKDRLETRRYEHMPKTYVHCYEV